MQPGVPHSHHPPVSMCPASATEANGVEFARLLSAEEAENNNGRMSMQTAANNNLVLTDLSSFKRFADLNAAMSYSGLYQFGASHLITGLYSRQVADYLGCRLVELAECYYASRKMGDLEKVSQILVTAPELPRLYENIGKYYQALCIQGFGRGDVEVRPDRLNRWTSQGENQVTSQSGNLIQLGAPKRPASTSLRDSVATRTKQRTSVVSLLEWKNEVTERKGPFKDRVTRLEELKKLATRQDSGDMGQAW